MIALLDLNFTLVANSDEVFYAGRAVQKECERYREWLVELLRSPAFEKVVLITARRPEDREWTLARILDQTGWQPDEAHFNGTHMRVPEFKENVLLTEVFPKYGTDPSRYIAFESNPRTREKYHLHGVPCLAAFPKSQGGKPNHAADRRPAPALFK